MKYFVELKCYGCDEILTSKESELYDIYEGLCEICYIESNDDLEEN